MTRSISAIALATAALIVAACSAGNINTPAMTASNLSTVRHGPKLVYVANLGNNTVTVYDQNGKQITNQRRLRQPQRYK